MALVEIAQGAPADLARLGPSTEAQFRDGDIAHLELKFSSLVVFPDAVAAAIDRALRFTSLDLADPVRATPDRNLVIRWRKNLPFLIGLAIVIGLLILAMFTRWVLSRDGKDIASIIPELSGPVMLALIVGVAIIVLTNPGRRSSIG